MSQRTLPLLFFNLGGEMLYILHQRLHAQNVVTGKTAKVMQDMVETMFREQWLEEVFQPQPIFSRNGLQMLLQGVAHSSIMRLSNVAMEKLYDLVSMAFKYQLMVCPRPEDIILVTFNHLDTIKTLVPDSHHCHDMIHTACRKINEHYSPLSKGEFISLRSTMLSLFQDSQKRISVLMRQKMQHHSGKFVIHIDGPIPVGFEIPGTIRYYSEEGEVSHTDRFPPAHLYTPPTKQGSWEMIGDRVTTLGLNIYEKEPTGSRSNQRSVSEGVLERHGRGSSSKSTSANETRKTDTQDEVAAAVTNVELALLHRLLVSPHAGKETSTFKLNLFPDLELDQDSTSQGDLEDTGNESAPGRATARGDKINVLHLKTNKKGTEDLERIREDFTTTDTEAGTEDDLLDLLDQAVA